MSFCKVCEKENQEHARFCGHCGRLLHDLTTETGGKLKTDERRHVASAKKPEEIVQQGETVLPTLHCRHLIDLFLHPRRFFSFLPTPDGKLFIFFAAWLYGICITLAAINFALSSPTSNSFGEHWVVGWLGAAIALMVLFARLLPREEWRIRLLLVLSVGALAIPLHSRGVWSQIAESWAEFWRSVVCISTFYSMLAWLILGEWYCYRLYWCGEENPDLEDARRMFFYSSLVVTAPTILAGILWTAFFSSPVEAVRDASSFSQAVRVLLLLLLLWSIYVSYYGATTSFRAKGSLTLVWFIILPILFYGYLVAIVGVRIW